MKTTKVVSRVALALPSANKKGKMNSRQPENSIDSFQIQRNIDLISFYNSHNPVNAKISKDHTIFVSHRS